MPPIRGEEVLVLDEVRVGGRRRGDLEGRPRGSCPCFEAGLDVREERIEVFDGARPGHVLGRCRARDDVRRLTATDHDAVHLAARGQLLTEQSDRDLGDHHCVPSVDALPWCGAGVGCPAGERDVELAHGEARRVQALNRPRVHHHGQVDAIEPPTLEHERLATAGLFGGCAKDAYLDAELVSDGCQSDRRPNA